MRPNVLIGGLLAAWALGANPAYAQPQSPGRVPWNQALSQPPSWYGSPESVRIAENLLLYQHPNGGWPKDIDMAAVLDAAARDQVLSAREQWQTTIDNGATHGQIRYLARMHGATGASDFAAGALRGLEYLLEAQYDNGGWPQFYPRREGYWQRITFNDGAMIGVMELLREVAGGAPPFAFVPADVRSRASRAVQSGVQVILRSQVEVDGMLTAWCAQHDENDLSPAQGRSYELPSLSGSESVGIVRYLMSIERPGPEVIRAIESAVAWFQEVELGGTRLERRDDPSLPQGFDRVVVHDPAAPPMWARFYEIGTNRPIFSGRDGVKKYALDEIEHERRIGYSWLGYYPAELLAREYPEWRRRWVEGSGARGR